MVKQVDQQEKLVILGSGPAGLTAGLYAARAGLHPLLLDGHNPGGQLIRTTNVENWPGEIKILGPTLITNLRNHARHFGTRFLSQTATQVDLHTSPFIVKTKTTSISTDALIIATGATSKQIHCPGEQEYWNKGVSVCAICDGVLFKDQRVIVVGGGDTALENALFLTNFTNTITIVQNLSTLTASKPMQDKVVNNPAITIIYNSKVTRICGDGEQVTKVVITNQHSHATSELPAKAVFIAVGLIPNTALFKDQLELTDYGYIKLKDYTSTSINGVFAAGDVADSRYRQAITSAATGCMASLDAERYLKESGR
jgi:thioredoxin reductase (NADPH)